MNTNVLTALYSKNESSLGRYTGGNVFSSIGRQGLKRAISSVASSTIAQKVANAVVNGAQKAVTAVVKGAPKVIANVAEKQAERFAEQHTPSIGKKNLKRGSTTPPAVLHSSPPSKKEKIDINKLIDGAGIVLD